MCNFGSAILTITLLACANGHIYRPFGPYLNPAPLRNPFAPLIPENYQHDNVLLSYILQPEYLPTLNILVEEPQLIQSDFTVVPLLVMSQNNMRLINNAKIMNASTEGPLMYVQKDGNELECLPAIRIVLRKKLSVYSLKSSIPFPATFEVHPAHGPRFLVGIGAVIAPVAPNTFVSTQTPAEVQVVYAVPTAPVRYDFIEDSNGVSEDNAGFAIESTYNPQQDKIRNVTVLDFPDRIAEPGVGTDIGLEDDELVNRNPPLVLAPAGIVQSSQPASVVGEFSNSKESPLLTTLREESLKLRPAN